MPHIISTTDEELQSLDLHKMAGDDLPYGPNDTSVSQAFSFGKDYFIEMVEKRVCFTGGRVLDLLSGYGRWLPFLAEFNSEVIALEKLENCQKLAKKICAHFHVENVHFYTGDISRIEEIEDESIDFVWMWSGLQYVDRAYAMSQINRVLVPNGRVFIGAYNGPGIMIEHLQKGIKDHTLFEGSARWALEGLSKGPEGNGNPNFLDIENCSSICEEFGFELVAAAPQKCIDVRMENSDNSGHELARYVCGYVRTIEFIAEKKSLLQQGQRKNGIVSQIKNVFR